MRQTAEKENKIGKQETERKKKKSADFLDLLRNTHTCTHFCSVSFPFLFSNRLLPFFLSAFENEDPNL